jgi:hypothetical protein
MTGSEANISARIYAAMLVAYPPEFRREFGDQMLQVFRDCYQAEASVGSLPGFWFRTLIDLVVTAAKERADSSGKEGVFMKRRSELVTLAVCVGVIVVAFLLFSYGKKYDVRSIGFFGYVLDPLITTGVVGNFILFILIKATKLNPLRTALWTFAIIHAGFLAFSVLVIGRLFPMFNLPAVTVGYLVSFAIWAGLHFALRRGAPVYS